MGAIDGSWAGLHGPGEKTIEKTGQLGPDCTRDLGLKRGPGSQGYSTAFKRTWPQGYQPHRDGNWGTGAREEGSGCTEDISRQYTYSCQIVSWGPCLWGPSAGVSMQKACQGPTPS